MRSDEYRQKKLSRRTIGVTQWTAWRIIVCAIAHNFRDA